MTIKIFVNCISIPTQNYRGQTAYFNYKPTSDSIDLEKWNFNLSRHFKAAKHFFAIFGDRVK